MNITQSEETMEEHIKLLLKLPSVEALLEFKQNKSMFQFSGKKKIMK